MKDVTDMFAACNEHLPRPRSVLGAENAEGSLLTRGVAGASAKGDGTGENTAVETVPLFFQSLHSWRKTITSSVVNHTGHLQVVTRDVKGR